MWILLSICLQFTLLKLLIKIQASNFIEDNAKYYTEKGYIEMLKWKRFINFINEFTTIEDAAIESVVIWDKYIAYAMACNINKTYNSKKLENINKIITNISTE